MLLVNLRHACGEVVTIRASIDIRVELSCCRRGVRRPSPLAQPCMCCDTPTVVLLNRLMAAVQGVHALQETSGNTAAQVGEYTGGAPRTRLDPPPPWSITPLDLTSTRLAGLGRAHTSTDHVDRLFSDNMHVVMVVLCADRDLSDPAHAPSSALPPDHTHTDIHRGRCGDNTRAQLRRGKLPSCFPCLNTVCHSRPCVV
jgi:hypothetical protein